MKYQKILIPLLLFGWFVALFFGILLLKNKSENSKKINIASLESKYPYLSKRILMEFPQDVLISFLELRYALRKETSSYGSSFGLYFEYLPTGTSININGNNEFYAASLFKLPVVMAYYKHKEKNGDKHDSELTLTQDMIDKDFGNLWKKGVGYKLNASDAVDLAIKESDNTAAKALVPLINKEDFDSVYEGLDIDLNSDNNGALLSAKNYTSILKALYFSSILNRDDSNLILEKLTKTKFPDKLVAGIPPEIPVAHKIGDYSDEKGNEAFMDCGIVFVPKRPYTLCMLSVSDEQEARIRMQKISKIVYEFVSSTEKN